MNLQEIEKHSYNIINEAGSHVLDIYRRYKRDNKLLVEIKSDETPVSEADKISNEILTTKLRHIYPVVSEEGQHHTQNETYFLIDPLDGTKEFINKNGEFCINVALVHQNRIVLGLINAPVFKLTYSAWKGGGIKKNGKRLIKRRTRSLVPKALASRYHNTKEFDIFCTKFGFKKYTSGSSLKFIKLIERHASIYPRFQGSSEWDIAPGVVLLQEMGGNIIDASFLTSGIKRELEFGKQSVQNPHFIAYASSSVLSLIDTTKNGQ